MNVSIEQISPEVDPQYTVEVDPGELSALQAGLEQVRGEVKAGRVLPFPWLEDSVLIEAIDNPITSAEGISEEETEREKFILPVDENLDLTYTEITTLAYAARRSKDIDDKSDAYRLLFNSNIVNWRRGMGNTEAS